MQVDIQKGESFHGYEIWPAIGLPVYVDGTTMRRLLKEASIRPPASNEVLHVELVIKKSTEAKS